MNQICRRARPVLVISKSYVARDRDFTLISVVICIQPTSSISKSLKDVFVYADTMPAVSKVFLNGPPNETVSRGSPTTGQASPSLYPASR